MEIRLITLVWIILITATVIIFSGLFFLGGLKRAVFVLSLVFLAVVFRSELMQWIIPFLGKFFMYYIRKL